MRKSMTGLAFVAMAFFFGGCLFGDSNDTSPSSVALSFAGTTGGASGSPPLRGTISDGTTTIDFTRVRILLRNVEFKREDDTAGTSPHEFEAGPTVIDLDVSGTASQVVASVVPAASYDEVKFVLHKIDPGDSQDAVAIAADQTGQFDDFLAGERYSLIVEGTVDATAFTYRARFDAEQTVALATPLVVTDGTDVNVTVSVDLNLWFRTRDSQGEPDPAGTLLDPSDTANQSDIDENIKRSFEGFRDNDRDGRVD